MAHDKYTALVDCGCWDGMTMHVFKEGQEIPHEHALKLPAKFMLRNGDMFDWSKEEQAVVKEQQSAQIAKVAEEKVKNKAESKKKAEVSGESGWTPPNG